MPDLNNFPFPQSFLGYELTSEDKEKLIADGYLGKKIQMIDLKTKDLFSGFIGIDPDQMKIVAVRASKFKIPDVLLQAPLSQEQKEQLGNGEKIHVEGMISKTDNQSFDGYVYINPAKKKFSFIRIN